MQIHESLPQAKTEGERLAKQGMFPTIYKTDDCEYYVAERNEMPPATSWPLLKWVGKSIGHLQDLDSEWIPILARLDTLESAQDACGLFRILGYDPVIVEYRNRGTFDIFLREEHIPPGGWVVLDSSNDGLIRHIQPSRYYDDEEFELVIESR